jgi:hypothetical protein
MRSWAEKEMQTLVLGDVRRGKRVARMLDVLSSKPRMSVPQACADKSKMNTAMRGISPPRDHLQTFQER